MSKIDELIKEKCLEGVEFCRLDEICVIQNGYTPSKKISQYWEDGDIPWFRMEDIRTNGKVLNHALQNVHHSGVKGEVFPANSIIFSTTATIGEHALITVPFLCNQQLTHIHIKENRRDNLDIKYLFYCSDIIDDLCRKHVKGGGTLSAVSLDKFRTFEIPVPPIEVQQEIVSILDRFTELEAGLQAELKARKKQYEHYRDELLTFADDVVVYKMGDVLTFLNGRAYKQEELLSEGKYPVLRVGNFYTNDSWYYSNLELEDNKYCEKGDLLYSWAATLGPKIWNGDKCIYHYHIWKILFDENIIDKNYLFYYLQYDLSNIARSTTNSTMIHVSMGSMKERMICIPPMHEQKRIVDILNKFNELCNDAQKGLLAEICVRKKQYEYYRDSLLSFERFGEQNE